ncbi:MAG: dihydrofolate reductase family protein, partial [Tepidiformaceae bacterium]
GRPVHQIPGPSGAGDLPAMLRHMRQDLGVRVLLCEGGPTTNAQFFELDVVDEYFVTLGPVIVAGKDTITAVEGPTAFPRDSLRHLELLAAIPNPETSEVYLHYRVRH